MARQGRRNVSEGTLLLDIWKQSAQGFRINHLQP